MVAGLPKFTARRAVSMPKARSLSDRMSGRSARPPSMAAVKRSDRRAFSAVSASMVRYARMISDTTASPLIGAAASCARVFLMLPPSVGTLLCSTAMSLLLLDYFIERAKALALTGIRRTSCPSAR